MVPLRLERLGVGVGPVCQTLADPFEERVDDLGLTVGAEPFRVSIASSRSWRGVVSLTPRLCSGRGCGAERLLWASPSFSGLPGSSGGAVSWAAAGSSGSAFGGSAGFCAGGSPARCFGFGFVLAAGLFGLGRRLLRLAGRSFSGAAAATSGVDAGTMSARVPVRQVWVGSGVAAGFFEAFGACVGFAGRRVREWAAATTADAFAGRCVSIAATAFGFFGFWAWWCGAVAATVAPPATTATAATFAAARLRTAPSVR